MSQNAVCKICGSGEPFHGHLDGKRVEDYFTIGRGLTELESAAIWQDRAVKAERKLNAAREALK